MTAHLLRSAALSLVLVFAAGCEPLLGPEPGVHESELTFIRVSADAPQLVSTTVSFWIKRGETREAEIRYTTYNGNGKCLLIRVPADSPLRHADGRPFATGDSALVTIRVGDPSLLRFEFDPGGLTFDPDDPAELEVRYRWADPDLNGDGVVDAEDARIQSEFGFWHQKRVGGRWERTPTVRVEEVFEARARITGFSQYALASN